MNRSAAVGRVQAILGFRTDLVSTIEGALQDAQIDLELQPPLPWFLVTEVSSNATVKDEERVIVPVNFLQDFEEDPLWYFDGTLADAEQWVVLPRDDLQILRANHPGSGKPKAYALVGQNYRIFPTPDAVYTLKQIYYKTDALLATNIENDWLKYAPNVLIGEAGLLLPPAVRSPESTTDFQRMSQKARVLLDHATEQRLNSNRRYIMGGPD